MAAQDLVTAYYGDSSSCIKQTLYPLDFLFAQSRPDGSKWSLSPQSENVIDSSPARFTSDGFQTYDGYFGNVS
jgi:hypothetical protein